MHDKRKKDTRTTEELVAGALQGGQDDEQAWEAIRELQRRGTRDILDAAQELLRSPLAKERGRGADILAQLGTPVRTFPAECVDALVSALRREADPGVLNSIAVALGHLDDERAVSVLVPLAGHSDPAVRSGVVFGLLGHSNEEAVDALIRLTSDPDEDIRNWATFGLGSQVEEVDTPELREALVRRLSDDNAEVRGEALIGLAKRKDSRVVDALRRELSGGNVDVCAIEAAKLLNETSLLPLLKHLHAMQGEADPGFEAAVVDAIKTLEGGPGARG